jgi:signal transduction histidine kinase
MLPFVGDAKSYLLSTLVALNDEQRVEAERDLVPLARAAALGELATDVAHDVANPLFGVLGLVDLLLDDAAPGSDEEARLQLLRRSALEMKSTLQALLDFARLPPDGPPADVVAAARRALVLARHGSGKLLEVEEDLPDGALRVACSQAPLVQAVLHLVLAARGSGRLRVAVDPDGAVRVSPAAARTVGVAVAARLAADAGGELAEEDGTYVLRLPRA